jgi:hypothetical protein
MIKLPNTLQEVFDIVSKHLLKQNERSLNPYPVPSSMLPECSYRGKDGTKCAAGVLISDEEYNAKFESWTWSGLVDNYIVEDKFKEEINDLQEIHDRWPVHSWRSRLNNFAKKHNLQVNF